MSDSPLIRLPPGLFITATGTGAGKTFVTRGLATALRAAGHHVAALKPIETGPAGPTSDAASLARAATRPGLSLSKVILESERGFYRAAMPAAPRAVSLATGLPGPDVEGLAAAVAEAAQDASVVLVEGAGGLLVPLDRHKTIADLARRLSLPLLLVAPNALGVLSHALSACESAERRNLSIAALVLTELAPTSDASDPSRPHNATILRERLAFPVLSFPFCPSPTDDAALAAAAVTAQLPTLLPSPPSG